MRSPLRVQGPMDGVAQAGRTNSLCSTFNLIQLHPGHLWPTPPPLWGWPSPPPSGGSCAPLWGCPVPPGAAAGSWQEPAICFAAQGALSPATVPLGTEACAGEGPGWLGEAGGRARPGQPGGRGRQAGRGFHPFLQPRALAPCCRREARVGGAGAAGVQHQAPRLRSGQRLNAAGLAGACSQ